MATLDNDRLRAATQEVIGNTFPTESNILARLNELDPPQGGRVDAIARSLIQHGMNPIAAEQYALGVGLGILLMVEADKEQ